MFDRLGAAAPAAGQRSYSPAARRPSPLSHGPSRPSNNLRSSSMTLLSRGNSSTDSLPRPQRAVNGSALRREPVTVPYFDDPLEVLEGIVGLPLPVDRSTDEDEPVKRPEELSEDLDLHGLSLEDFAARIPEATTPARRYTYSAESAVEYEKESARFEDLHKSILACDGVLKSVESSLEGFQKDLAAVSTEIEALQSRSIAMNTRLENRKVVEQLLGPAVEDIAIAPGVVKTISDRPIDDTWLKALAELQKRIKAVGNKVKTAEGNAPNKALDDMAPLFENLSAKASGKIRDHLVAQIKSFRSPGINAQIIQQSMVKHRDLYTFLTKAQPQLATELAQAYVNTMRWYYASHFERYKLALAKLNVINESATIGMDASSAKSKPSGPPATHDPFALGRRGDALKPSNTAAISSYLAEEDKTSRTLEVPYRSFNQALVDNVAAEYGFLTTFFAAIPAAQLDRHAARIFAPTFNIGNTLASELVTSSTDCIGILLCVRLTQRFAREQQRRLVPIADSYINGLNMLLWPRFQQAMDAQTDSIKAMTGGGTGGAGSGSNLASRSAASKLAFASSTGADPNKLSTAPHVLTQRVAQLLHGLVALSAEAGDDEPVVRSLGRLRAEFEHFLTLASRGAGADAKKRERFLANNYALVLTILADSEGRLADEQKAHFEDVKARLKV